MMKKISTGCKRCLATIHVSDTIMPLIIQSASEGKTSTTINVDETNLEYRDTISSFLRNVRYNVSYADRMSGETVIGTTFTIDWDISEEPV